MQTDIIINDQPITKKFSPDPDKLTVKEIFFTIQGEGPFSGTPAVFVRFTGCNLRCYWCDTDYTGGTVYTASHLVDAVMQELKGTPPNTMIVLTGGEPMAQQISPFIELLTRRSSFDGNKRTIQIETNGTACPDDFPWTWLNVFVVVSPKTGKLHPDIPLEKVTAWKYIINGPEDIALDDMLPMQSTQASKVRVRLARAPAEQPIYISPLDNGDQKRSIDLCVLITKAKGYKLSLQIHKIIGVE